MVNTKRRVKMAVLLYFHPQCLLFGLSGLNSEGKKLCHPRIFRIFWLKAVLSMLFLCIN